MAWIYEDQLPDGYPYHIMFPYSEVRDGVRMFPVYAPLPADRIMEVIGKALPPAAMFHIDQKTKDRLWSGLDELGLK